MLVTSRMAFRTIIRFRSIISTSLLASLAACVEPLHLSPSNAATVLARRTINAPNPGTPGDLKVERLYYGSGKDIRRPEYRDSITYKTATVDASPFAKMDGELAKSRKKYWGYDNKAFPLNARVWYPTGDGPFPLVLVVHGNHNMKEFSDPGYQWLGEFLASKGYILASIDENFLNGNLRNENDARGWMLLKHLEVFRALNDSSDKPLFHKIDMSRITLMGHSRGGEAVAIAGAFNRLSAYPDDATIKFNFNFDIKSLVAIAPVDGQYRPADKPTPVSNYNYLVMHGSHDGDVSSFSGLIQYNRFFFTKPSNQFKSAFWVYRANHGQWNTVWGAKDNGPTSGRALDLKALMSGDEQRQFGRVAIGAFLDATIKGADEYRALFRDYRSAGDWLPPTMYLTRYADANTHWLATFEEDVDVTTGTAPLVRINADSVSIWKESDVPARSRSSTFSDNVVTVGWNNTPAAGGDSTPRWPARFSITVPDSLRSAWQLNNQSVLLFTMGTTTQKPSARKSAPQPAKDSSAGRDSSQSATQAAAQSASRGAKKDSQASQSATASKSAAPDTVPPDFTIELTDNAGNVARLPLSSLGVVRMPIESYIYRRKGRDKSRFPTLSEQVMQTYVAPLSAFSGANSSFQPSLLSNIRFVFDKKPVGAIVLDDIGITSGNH